MDNTTSKSFETNALRALQQLVERLENYYDFECTGGPLRNCLDWQQLKALLVTLAPQPTGHDPACNGGLDGHQGETCCEYLARSCQELSQARQAVYEIGVADGRDGVTLAPHEEPWQPIATAPKDGARMLLGYLDVERSALMCWVEHFGGWHEPGTGRCRPTHWMPLPPPPVESATDA